MSFWVQKLLPLVQAALALARMFVAWRQRQLGRVGAQKDQLEKDHEVLRRAADARRHINHTAERVQRDPRNRDAG